MTVALDALWAAIAAAVLGLVLAGHVPGRPVRRVGDLLRAAVQRPWARVLLLVGWLWLGWHFFAR
jgi:hypothetical protein